jgi:hypothetical protein
MQNIKEILENLGYTLSDDGARFWRMAAVYRDGDNPTALRVSKKNGSFIDFVDNKSGPFYRLIQITLGLKRPKDAKQWLENKQFVAQTTKEIPKIVMPENWNVKILDKLIRDHQYWNKRGIDSKIVEQFQGGVAIEGRMANRYIFPIFKNEKIIGFDGRDITGKHKIKWKIIGEKSNFVFPININRQSIIEKREVFLVESIGDLLSMFQAGFDNTLCLFGTYLSDKIISALVGLQPKKIFICTNNDQENNNVGNQKACGIYLRLIKFFDKEKIKIKLPIKNDFGVMNTEEIRKWYELNTLAVVGTREFTDYNKLQEILTPYKDQTGQVVSGAALGTDRLGRRWAHENKIPLIEFLPNWDKFGKAAGPIRNEYIIQNADSVVAVFQEGCRGTQNDIDIANRLGKPLEIIHYKA